MLEPFGIHTRHPDMFFGEIENIDPGALLEAAARDMAHYRNPPLSLDEYADGFRKAGCGGLADYLIRMRVMVEP